MLSISNGNFPCNTFFIPSLITWNNKPQSKKKERKIIIWIWFDTGVLLAILEKGGVISPIVNIYDDHVEKTSAGTVSAGYQNFFICIEMLFAAIALRYAFPYQVCWRFICFCSILSFSDLKIWFLITLGVELIWKVYFSVEVKMCCVILAFKVDVFNLWLWMRSNKEKIFRNLIFYGKLKTKSRVVSKFQ